MGNFEFAVAFAQVAIMALHVNPLTAARNVYDITEAMRWTKQLSTSCSEITGALLYACAFNLWGHCVMVSITNHHEARNNLVEDSSQRWNLTEYFLLSHFNLVYP